MVNGKRVDIPSARVKPGSEILLTAHGYGGQTYQDAIISPRLPLPVWLQYRSLGDQVAIVAISSSASTGFATCASKPALCERCARPDRRRR